MMRKLTEVEARHWKMIVASLQEAIKNMETACGLMQTPNEPFCPLVEWNPAWALMNHIEDQLSELTNNLTPRYVRTPEGEWVWTAPRIWGIRGLD